MEENVRKCKGFCKILATHMHKYVATSVSTRSGHPDYPGHPDNPGCLGHFLSGSKWGSPALFA